jgi:hypothetical protein
MKERALSMANKLAHLKALKLAKKLLFARFLYIQAIQEF